MNYTSKVEQIKQGIKPTDLQPYSTPPELPEIRKVLC